MNDHFNEAHGPLPVCEGVPTPALGDSPALEQLGRLLDVTQDLLAVLGFDARLKYANSSWERTLGYSREELMAESPTVFVHPDDRAATLADIQKVLSGTETTSFENRLRCIDGSY